MFNYAICKYTCLVNYLRVTFDAIHGTLSVLTLLQPVVCCSRNQLSVIPPFISRLELLQVLLVSNNKLVSLPEEIGRLKHLMQLVRCLHFSVVVVTETTVAV